MKGFQVYGVVGSPFVRSVLLGLEEKRASYALMPMAPGELKAERHLRRHPFGRVPAFEHDGFELYETQAILRYLDRILPEPALTPGDPRAAARMDQLIGISDWYMFGDVTRTIGFERTIRPSFLGQPTDELACAAAEPKAKVCVDEIARLLGNGPYMTGAAVSLADLMLAPQFEYLSITPEGGRLLAPHAELRSWLERMQARDSMQATTLERLARRFSRAA